MSLSSFFVFLLVALPLAGAVYMLYSNHLLKATLSLMVIVLSIAGIYVFLRAEFVAVTQILVYAGGILILILFSIMLTQNRENPYLFVGTRNLIFGALVGCSFLVILVSGFWLYPFNSIPSITNPEPVVTLGLKMVTDFLFPFEVAGLLLLAVLIGALTLFQIKRQDEK